VKDFGYKQDKRDEILLKLKV